MTKVFVEQPLASPLLLNNDKNILSQILLAHTSDLHLWADEGVYFSVPLDCDWETL